GFWQRPSPSARTRRRSSSASTSRACAKGYSRTRSTSPAVSRAARSAHLPLALSTDGFFAQDAEVAAAHGHPGRIEPLEQRDRVLTRGAHEIAERGHRQTPGL